MKPLIFLISGPSGSGKTTLLKNLLQHRGLKGKLAKSVSLTTRPKRSGEQNGKDYFFISERDFFRKRKDKKILEWTKYLGYYYATPKDFLERQLAKGKSVALCLDLRGALRIKRFYPQNSITIFIQPPSLSTLRQRIEQRCNKTKKEEILKRLKLAKQELRAASKYDYSLVNQDLTETVKKLKGIVLKEITAKAR